MQFDNKIQFMLFLSKFKSIGSGSQGICYLDSVNNKIYKVFHQFYDIDDDFDYYHDYTKEEILRFSSIKNNTFLWPNEVIIVNGEIVGYICDYVKASSLYETNPLHIDLDNFIELLDYVKKDLTIISDNRIRSFDMMYNILYSNQGIFVIDHDDYSFSDIEPKKLFTINSDNFNKEIMYFFIDTFFDDFIKSHSDLKDMYNSSGIDIKEFLILFRYYLSEKMDFEVKNLGECSKYLNKTRYSKNKYQRILVDR